MAEFVVDFYSEHDGVRCEEIVRCRDCELYEDMAFMLRNVPVCKRHGESWHLTEPDGFCKWGVRKVDE